MPLVKIENINDGVFWGLWKIEENADFLLEKTLLSEFEKQELTHISNVKKRKEWLGARALLKCMVEERQIPFFGVLKDQFSKPSLIGNDMNISISHCFPYAVILMNELSPCGIDIEQPKPALFHIAPKFLNDSEQQFMERNPRSLCLAWAAKEALFKIHGLKHLSFKNAIELSPFQIASEGVIEAKVICDNMERQFSLKYQIIDEHVVCYNF